MPFWREFPSRWQFCQKRKVPNPNLTGILPVEWTVLHLGDWHKIRYGFFKAYKKSHSDSYVPHLKNLSWRTFVYLSFLPFPPFGLNYWDILRNVFENREWFYLKCWYFASFQEIWHFMKDVTLDNFLYPMHLIYEVNLLVF